MVANLVRTFIRTVMSLVREQSGTVMCVNEGVGQEGGVGLEQQQYGQCGHALVTVICVFRYEISVIV